MFYKSVRRLVAEPDGVWAQQRDHVAEALRVFVDYFPDGREDLSVLPVVKTFGECRLVENVELGLQQRYPCSNSGVPGCVRD